MATRKKTRKPTAHRDPVDEHAATELVMFIENTSDLSPDGPSGQGRNVLLNALRKWRKGTYDPVLTVRLFEYLAEAGAKRYQKEFGSDAPIFNPATRHEAAKQLEESFRGSVEGGEYDHVDTRVGVHTEEAPRVAQRMQESGMFRVGSEKVAADIARKEGLCWGWSVFGPGGWYVGTRVQLERIGVIANDMQCSDDRERTPTHRRATRIGARAEEAREAPLAVATASDKRAVDFFYKHAGYGYGPGETPEQGRERGAVKLANAEQEATARGWTVDWEEDPEGWDSLGDIDPDTVKEILTAVLRDEDGAVLASLGGIVNPDRAYRRVVEAELALEALPSGSAGARASEARRRPSRNPPASYPYGSSASGQYILSHDGSEIMRGTEQEIWRWMHSNLGYSIDHALKYEGYKIVPTGNVDEVEEDRPRMGRR